QDITTASLDVSATTITVTLTVGATANSDTLTISGIQVQASEGGDIPAAGSIFRASADPGTASIAGITDDVTDFGALSQTVGSMRLYVVLPGQAFTDASTVAASGITGAPSDQTAGVSFDLTQLVAADRQFNIAGAYSGTEP